MAVLSLSRVRIIGLIVAFCVKTNTPHYVTPCGVPVYSFRFPGIPLLKQLHRRAILYRPYEALIFRLTAQ